MKKITRKEALRISKKILADSEQERLPHPDKWKLDDSFMELDIVLNDPFNTEELLEKLKLYLLSLTTSSYDEMPIIYDHRLRERIINTIDSEYNLEEKLGSLFNLMDDIAPIGCYFDSNPIDGRVFRFRYINE